MSRTPRYPAFETRFSGGKLRALVPGSAAAGLAKTRSPKAGQNEKKLQQSAQDGFGWLGLNWSVKGNPCRFTANHTCYLYGLERACVLGGLGRLNGHDWYWEGGLMLLLRQEAGGAWAEGGTAHLHFTCFALLFLKRATVPLISNK